MLLFYYYWDDIKEYQKCSETLEAAHSQSTPRPAFLLCRDIIYYLLRGGKGASPTEHHLIAVVVDSVLLPTQPIKSGKCEGKTMLVITHCVLDYLGLFFGLVSVFF